MALYGHPKDVLQNGPLIELQKKMNIRILLLFFVITLYLTCLPLCNNFFSHKYKILSKIYNKSFGSGTLLTSHSLLIYPPPLLPQPQAHTFNTSIKIDKSI